MSGKCACIVFLERLFSSAGYTAGKKKPAARNVGIEWSDLYYIIWAVVGYVVLTVL